MRMISNSEFAAHPDMYLDLAREQEVRIRRGREVFSLAPDYDEPRELTDDQVWGLFAKRYPDGLPPLGSDEEEIANSITGEELLRRFDERLKQKWAERLK